PRPDALFRDGFENAGAAIAGEVSKSARATGAQLARIDASHVLLTLTFANRSSTIEPARSIAIGAERAVVVERIDARGMACVLQGAIECEALELAPAAEASVRVLLEIDPAALTDLIYGIDQGGGMRFGRSTAYPAE